MPNAKLCISSKQMKFDKDYRVYDLEWPVYIIECVANKIQDKQLNILQLAVLRLLSVRNMSAKVLADRLGISVEIIKVILAELVDEKWINDSDKVLTDKGVALLNGDDIDDFSKTRTFGYMFVSRIDDFVMPYFWEGELPIIRDLEFEPDALILRYDNHKKLQYKGLDSKLHNAYVDYVKLFNRTSKKDQEKNEQSPEIRFVSRSVFSPELEASFDSDVLKDKQSSPKETDLKIHALATGQKEAYLTFKLCVSKASPGTFYVVSPFIDQDTPRYSRTFKQMKNDKEVNVLFDDNIISLNKWCEDLTKEIYESFPMLKRKLDDDSYLKLTYPTLPMLGQYRKVITKELLEVVNHIRLWEAKELDAKSLIMAMGRALELILNCIIEGTDINATTTRYKNTVKSENDIESMLFQRFKIYSCSALSKEKKALKKLCYSQRYDGIMSSFRIKGTDKRLGISLVDKYFYLLVDACFNDSKMRMLINNEGADFIDNLDNLIKMRNTYGAHCGKTTDMVVTYSEVESVIESFDNISKSLLSTM